MKVHAKQLYVTHPYLYPGESLNECRPTSQNPTVLGVRIERRCLCPFLLRPGHVQNQTMSNVETGFEAKNKPMSNQIIAAINKIGAGTIA